MKRGIGKWVIEKAIKKCCYHAVAESLNTQVDQRKMDTLITLLCKSASKSFRKSPGQGSFTKRMSINVTEQSLGLTFASYPTV